MEAVKREVEVLRRLRGCLNVAALEDVYEDDTHVHMVLEFCKGGELHHRIGETHYSGKRGMVCMCGLDGHTTVCGFCGFSVARLPTGLPACAGFVQHMLLQSAAGRVDRKTTLLLRAVQLEAFTDVSWPFAKVQLKRWL